MGVQVPPPVLTRKLADVEDGKRNTMAKPEEAKLWNELASVSLYKRNQGRLTRQLTAAALGLIVVVGAYILSRGPLFSYSPPVRVGIPLALALIAGWLVFRVLNWPRFAEFLISVEGEMAKVSWPSRQELVRATSVVIGSMAFLTAVLYLFDSFWAWLLVRLGVVLL